MLRIANCSGYFGDRISAAREMVDGGPVDVLTGDYLAELTMLILDKNRRREAGTGYASTFVRQMEDVLGDCLERGIKVVSNAGGLDPAGLVARLDEIARGLGLSPRIAHLEGDDLLDQLGELQAAGHPLTHLNTGRPLSDAPATPMTANAYLGGWGIADALAAGADVVVCPRVTDAALTVGPAAWAFDWATDDWDRLAGAVVAGHVIECGPQATGGNYCFFTELANPLRPGFPIAEMHADGSSVITKHPGTGGAVTIDTVTAQLLYEIDEPRYRNPDVVTRFDTIALEPDGPDRVRISGVRGEPAPDHAKVAINYQGGFRNTATFVLTPPNLEAKARFVTDGFLDGLGGEKSVDRVDVRLLGPGEDGATALPVNADGVARLRITVMDADGKRIGRPVFDAANQLALSSYPGMFAEAVGRTASEFGVYWPALVPASEVTTTVVLPDGTRREARRPATTEAFAPPAAPPEPTAAAPAGATRSVGLGTVMGARSGDKGGNANLGVWARSDEAWAWLRGFLTVERLRVLMPEICELRIDRYELPIIRSINFVVHQLLDEGVAATTRPDPQAKGLGEFLRSRVAEVPVDLLP
jgi:hypothetical protein